MGGREADLLKRAGTILRGRVLRRSYCRYPLSPDGELIFAPGGNRQVISEILSSHRNKKPCVHSMFITKLVVPLKRNVSWLFCGPVGGP